tara:strand:+ start:1932 stop:3821 length:1890 start_codon:yes stop_codon:yes gene_type:complete
MSGIAGIINLNKKKVDKEKINTLKDNLIYRAHDGFQEYTDNSASLIYAKLCVTEQCSGDQQPLFDLAENILIVSNSRLDNRNELIKKLKVSESLTDCELILAGYKIWKEEIVDHLIGPFSFVIFNKKKQHIFSAVDHFAQKPLYFSLRNDQFIFSSDARAISFLDPSFYSINNEKILDYLIFQGCVNNASFYNKVFKINKGQCLKIKENKLNISEYYSLPNIKKPVQGNSSKEIREIMTEVIASQSRSNNTKISTTCSGGLDSTSIASLLNKEIKHKDIQSFSVHFDNLNKDEFSKTDERFFVEKFEEKFNAQHKYIISQNTPLNYLDKQLSKAYFPPKSGNGYMHQEIIDEMKKKEIRVLFDGFDGDSVISHGAEYLVELGLESNLKKLLSEVKSACKLNGRKFSTFHTLKNFWIKPNIPFGVKVFFNRFTSSGVTEEKKFQNLSEAAKKMVDFPKKFMNYYPNESYKHKKSLTAHRNGLSLPFWEEELEIIDFIASINGIDIRLPFMDKRVVEYCLKVPGSEKFKNGVTRAYFREGMRGIAPDEVLDKHTKANLGPVIMNEIRDNYKMMLRVIESSNTEIIQIISKKKIHILMSKKFEELSKLEKVNIYKWYVLEKWLSKNNYKILI